MSGFQAPDKRWFRKLNMTIDQIDQLYQDEPRADVRKVWVRQAVVDAMHEAMRIDRANRPIGEDVPYEAWLAQQGIDPDTGECS